MVGAFNNNACGVVDEVDDTVGALTNTDAAADTLLGVNLSYAALNRDSALGTNCCAVAVTKTSVGTGLVAAVRHVSGKTGLNAANKLVLSFHYVAGAVAGNVSYLFYNVCCLNAEDSGNFLCHAVTAGDTEVGLFCGLLCESLCISVTSAEAAGATVSAGKAVTDSKGGFVLLDAEEHARYSKKSRANDCNTNKE